MFDTIPTWLTLLGSSLAVMVGFWLKANPNIKNGLIPWVTFVISFLTQVLQNAGTAEAAGFGDPLYAISLGGFGGWLVKVVISAIAQAALTTGAYSWTKNGVVEFGKR